MYVFKRDGQEVAAQEWPVWVQLQENGCYGLCEAADAQGVVLGGVVYSLSNRTPMEGTEEVAAEVVESVPYLREKVDTIESQLSLQTSATEVVFVTLAEAGTIDAVTAGEHRTMFAAWTAGVAYSVPGAVGIVRARGLAPCRPRLRRIRCRRPQGRRLVRLPAGLGRVSLYAAVQLLAVVAELAHRIGHNGKHWTSDAANNVWEPGVYGWTENADG